MRVVAYSIKNFEKELLAKANQKKHDITLISNPLSLQTALYAEGKDAVVVFTNDDLSGPVINKLADMGIKYIATRSVGTDHIDLVQAEKRNIKIASIPAYSPEAVAEFAVTLALALSRKLIPSVDHSRQLDFSMNQNPGFNFHGKTVGIIGFGNTGQATASIFRGFGCKVLTYDSSPVLKATQSKAVSLDKLLNDSDIISLHIPLTADTHHLIDESAIAKMKKGVMIINTSRGGLINTEDALKALNNGKIGYLGLDVYEQETPLLNCRQPEQVNDPLLEQLVLHPNVIVTPNQAYLTVEALHDIALQTIGNLDQWQKSSSSDKACA